MTVHRSKAKMTSRSLQRPQAPPTTSSDFLRTGTPPPPQQTSDLVTVHRFIPSTLPLTQIHLAAASLLSQMHYCPQISHPSGIVVFDNLADDLWPHCQCHTSLQTSPSSSSSSCATVDRQHVIVSTRSLITRRRLQSPQSLSSTSGTHRGDLVDAVLPSRCHRWHPSSTTAASISSSLPSTTRSAATIIALGVNLELWLLLSSPQT